VVGEDLGNVEPWVRDYLRERGVLGTSILWFEKDEDGPAQAAEVARAVPGDRDHPRPAAHGRVPGR
jgi:4-alpha-glucanotransferase